MYLPNPSALAGRKKWSVFKRSSTGSELSFLPNCHTKVEEPRLPYYLSHSWIPTFSKSISKYEQPSLGFEPVSPCSFSMAITITLPEIPWNTLLSTTSVFFTVYSLKWSKTTATKKEIKVIINKRKYKNKSFMHSAYYHHKFTLLKLRIRFP